MTDSYTFDAAAAILDIGRNTLIRRLRELGMIDATKMPTGRYRGRGIFIVRLHHYLHPTKGLTYYTRTEITPAGLEHIRKRLAGISDQPAATATGTKKSEKSTMPQDTVLPMGTLHDAGELTIITPDGERVHHRCAAVVVFESPFDLQRAINAHRCAYRIRRDIPDEQLHPELTARRA